MIESVDTSREAVRNTGTAFLIAGIVLGSILFLGSSNWFAFDFERGLARTTWRWFLGVGCGLFALSRVSYALMKPVHIGWMTIAQVLGWFSTRLLLGIFFYLIITPTAVVMKLLGKDLLSEQWDREAKSYWVKKERVPLDPRTYERQF